MPTSAREFVELQCIARETRNLCEALCSKEAGPSCSSNHWTRDRLASSLWTKQAFWGSGQQEMYHHPPSQPAKDILSFLFLFKVLLGSLTPGHFWETSNRKWRLGQKALPALFRDFILNGSNVRSPSEEKPSADIGYLKKVGCVLGEVYDLGTARGPGWISVRQRGDAPVSMLANGKTSMPFMLRVNIWLLNRIPAPSETGRNSGLCPWLLNVPYSATLQRNKGGKLIGIKVLQRSCFCRPI